MKIFSQLAGLSAAATLILQFGTFVEASPFFDESFTSSHSNAVDYTQQCQGFHFSFPSASGLSFEEQSKHIVAWQAPSTMGKVTLTLVKDDDSSAIHIGNFAASRGASDELPLDLKGQLPGKYHYHMQATGSTGDCNVDSVAFTIKQQNGGQHSNSDETFDNIVQSIQSQSPSANDHTDAQLDDLINNLKYTQAGHANDEAFDNIVQTIQSQSPSANDHTDAQLDDLIADLPTAHKDANADWDAMINDLETHSDSAVDHTDSTSFNAFIDELDQDYTKYIDKNKATETDQVNHKNDAEWFTNSDLRTTIKKMKRAFRRSLMKRGWDDSAHNEWAEDVEWATNDDQRTNVHNDAEWAEDVTDGVWHMDEIVDTPEWTVSDTVTDDHQNNMWETAAFEDEAPNHHHNDIEWNVNTENAIVDHSNNVHWDAEINDMEDENDEDHMNAAPEGEWVDDNHTNAADDQLEWAQDSIELMEDDAHDNGWKTGDDNGWGLNEGATEWNSNDELVPNVPGHGNEWRSGEHDDDGSSEWSVDNDDHSNDATLTSEWRTDEHANNDEPRWNANDASSGWSVDEAATGWSVNEAVTGWSVNEASSEWTTIPGQHEDANEWNVNEATGGWNVDPAGESIQSHSNADPQWLSAESVHSNDVNW